MSEIVVGGALKMSEQNCPTRAGELINSISEIYDIPNPRVGMLVYAKDSRLQYVIRSLKEKTIGGIVVSDAMVDEYELCDAAHEAEKREELTKVVNAETEARQEQDTVLSGAIAKLSLTIVNYNVYKGTDSVYTLATILADSGFITRCSYGTILTFKKAEGKWARYQYVGAANYNSFITASNWREISAATYGISQTADANKVQISTTGEAGGTKDILNIAAATTEKAGVMTASDKAKLNKCVVEADLGNAVYDMTGEAGESNFTLNLINKSGETVVTRTIPEATVYSAGLLSKDNFIGLSNLLKKQLQEVNSITWSSASHINNFTRQGVYIISGERTSNIDGLPIDNAASGHTISGRLYVLDSSINSSEVCITQILMLSNRVGTDGNVYLRTGNASSYATLMSSSSTAWEEWQTLQGIKMIGKVSSVDSYVDNGLYSGVLTDETTQFDTFVMLVINNYSISSFLTTMLGYTIPKQCTQFLYSLPAAMTSEAQSGNAAQASIKIRTGVYIDDNYKWSKWEGIPTITLE